jgi:peroxiredoxin
MRKLLLILFALSICVAIHAQLLNPNLNPQLKLIAYQLIVAKDYRADCNLTISLPYGGTLSSATSITVKKIPSDTLCGFNYHFKTHDEFKTVSGDFTAFFQNTYYASRNGIVSKISVLKEPEKFKKTIIPQGYVPAIHRTSLFFQVTPYQIGEFINNISHENDATIVQLPDTIINSKYCLRFILKDKFYNSPRKTELCFEKKSLTPIYYRQDINEGANNQYQIARFTNSKVNAGLPLDYFTEENIAGKEILDRSTIQSIKKSMKIGQVVPDWRLPILGANKNLSSKELRGKFILLEFTGTWCPHCGDAVKMMNRLEDEFRINSTLQILSIFNAEIDTEDRITKFAKDLNAKSTILHSATSVGDQYYVTVYPTFFIIDTAGKLLMAKTGYSQDIENVIVSFLRNNIK